MARRVGFLATHPIQYQVPWLRDFSRRPGIDLTVLYSMVPDARQQGDGFCVDFQWDLPLLEGYPYVILQNVSRRPSLTSFSGCDTPSVGAVIRERAFEALIVNGWGAKSCLQALWACRRAGVPCIVRGESNAFRRRPLWVRGIHRALLRQYAAFLTIGKANRRFYLDNGVDPALCFDAPYAVDNERFATQAAGLAPGREALRRRWGIPQDARCFLFCGKLIPMKRPRDLLDALALAVRETTTPVHALVAGDGILREPLETLARERGLPVTFAGFLNQTQVAEAYVAADCLVLPSDAGETWGLVVNEAMACGRPALVSDRVGCHPDLVITGETGEVFPLGDTAALAHHMASLASDPERARTMGRNASGHVAAFSTARVADAALAAVTRVLEGQGRAT